MSASSNIPSSPAPESVRPGEVVVFSYPLGIPGYPLLDEIPRRIIGNAELFAALNGDLGPGEFLYKPDHLFERSHTADIGGFEKKFAATSATAKGLIKP